MDTKRVAHNRNVYWRRVRTFTFSLIGVWFVMTFGIIFFARELAEITVFGWPLSFYMAAQGLTLLYVIIVAVYAVCMRRLDKTLKSETTNVR